MSRQVDVKAIVSHIVRGDGLDKCRICMGSTKDGQVFLGDTVMMDAGKPVTLADVLKGITGMQMQLEEGLPSGICTVCFQSALNAADFRILCLRANNKWNILIELIENLPNDADEQNTALFAFINKNQISIINGFIESPKSAVDKLTAHLSLPKSQKSTYHCSDCNKIFHYPQLLYNHLKESTDLKRACYICGNIMHRTELVDHLNKVHDVEVIECKSCPAVFSSQRHYSQHLNKFHSQRFVCIDCGLTFQSANAHHAHMSIHTEKSCPKCDKQFRNQKCYLHHFKHCTVLKPALKRASKTGTRGRVRRKCVCDYCGKTYADKKVISAHIQIVHMKNTHQPCEICGKVLAAAHMNNHVQTHIFIHPFKCEHCGMIFKTRLGCIQHVRLHTGERPYPCSHCGETFSASSRRSEHIRKTHRTDVVLKHGCQFCPAKFRLPYRLRNHLMTSHRDTCDIPEMKYKCTKCKEAFGTWRGLVHHSKTHQNVCLLKQQKRDAGFNLVNVDYEHRREK